MTPERSKIATEHVVQMLGDEYDSRVVFKGRSAPPPPPPQCHRAPQTPGSSKTDIAWKTLQATSAAEVQATDDTRGRWENGPTI
ncbi:hypothetical protein VZT92_018666 [Zoarces viviparus]|uniref:Uncharacterized protein n=1 Tax=Zoarces viviparus TaxID=48416 RepID=A0AAW1EJI9_ZOAVI